VDRKALPPFQQPLLRRRWLLAFEGQVNPTGLPLLVYSIKTALIERRQDASFGKILTTAVHLRISRFKRSIGLEVRSLRWCLTGEANTVNPYVMFFSIQSASREAVLAYISTIFFRWASAIGRSRSKDRVKLVSCRMKEFRWNSLELIFRID
jgi:hypothetical protein